MQRVFGYARVSSKEQNLERQIIALKEHVPEDHIIVDKSTGSNLEREGYIALKGKLGLRRGDVLYITSLDRLSRNKEDIKNELEWFKENEIRLMILDLPTSLIKVPEGQEWIIEMINNILVEVLSSMAQQERILIRKRQKQGIDAAKKKGVHIGRPRIELPDNFENIVSQWESGIITAREAQRQLNISSSSFYRLMKQRKGH